MARNFHVSLCLHLTANKRRVDQCHPMQAQTPCIWGHKQPYKKSRSVSIQPTGRGYKAKMLLQYITCPAKLKVLHSFFRANCFKAFSTTISNTKSAKTRFCAFCIGGNKLFSLFALMPYFWRKNNSIGQQLALSEMGNLRVALAHGKLFLGAGCFCNGWQGGGLHPMQMWCNCIWLYRGDEPDN